MSGLDRFRRAAVTGSLGVVRRSLAEDFRDSMSTQNASERSASRIGILTWLALAVALCAVAGSLYFSAGLGLKACPLCIYQRSFVLGVFGLMLVGLGCDARPGLLSLLALPMASAALTVAVFHVSLELRGILECPAGILRIGSVPQQACAILAVLFLVLVLDASGVGAGKRLRLPLPGGALLLGLLLGVASIASAPPLPKVPSGGWELPVDRDGCRPPA